MPQLAKKIILHVDAAGNGRVLEIDGQEFPWHIAAELSIETTTLMPMLNVSIPAGEITVLDPNGNKTVLPTFDGKLQP